MELSAQRVRAKARAAVKRREDLIAQDELESGELNLIPYLDMVTNLMLFLLASVSAGFILVQIDTTLPDKQTAPSPVTQSPSTSPDDQPLKLVVSITRDRVILWSISGLEGTLAAPKQVFPRSGRDGEACDGAYMCESNACDAATQRCVPSRDDPAPVFDYRAMQAARVRQGGHPVRAAHRGSGAQEGQGPDRAERQAVRHRARGLRPQEDGAVPRHPVLLGIRMTRSLRSTRDRASLRRGGN